MNIHLRKFSNNEIKIAVPLFFQRKLLPLQKIIAKWSLIV